jgi:hypothetical protein
MGLPTSKTVRTRSGSDATRTLDGPRRGVGHLAGEKEEYIRDLTGESLQSAEQLFRAAKALGVPERSLEVDAKRMKNIFAVRNQIIHEIDIHLDAKDKQARKRRSRTIDGMNDDADCLLRVGRRVIGAAEENLRGCRG